ncbi:MAG: FG-GAP repeat protein, partial [Deltaproteobacteria bacterium]|nr:FG-GAP repeat protein [Deltaproteobacteria bacterium]
MEHGYEIARRPTGPGAYLVVTSRYEGLACRTEDGGQAVTFHDGSADRVRYDSLAVRDANGVPLHAWMAGHDGLLRIVIDDTDAAYPIEIDPLATSPAWTAESDQVGAWLGSSVASAGDVNGDGYDDVVVGAPLFDNGQTDEGRAWVFLGWAYGLLPSAAWSTEGNQDYAELGAAVASEGAVN